MSTQPRTSEEVLRACRRSLEQGSKSFALAARLLAPTERDRVAAVYAFCRRVDDAIDGAPAHEQPAALAALRNALDALYAGEPMADPAFCAFQAVVKSSHIPRVYPLELIEGMAMDVSGARYDTLEELLQYCHRVAAVVGLMMCHVLGIRSDDALENAAHLGIAMQLTNICRDVQEDWGLGRLYLPRTMLREAGAPELPDPVTGPFPRQHAAAIRRVVRALLTEADRYYASADAGITALPWRAGLAVRAARGLYHAIGVVIEKRDYDPTRGRAVVSWMQKLALVSQALWRHARNTLELLRRNRTLLLPRAPARVLEFPGTILR